MPLFKRRKTRKELEQENEIRLMIKTELNDLLSDENIKRHLRKMRHDKEKWERWNSLSNTTKIKILKYAKEKRDGQRNEKT